MSVTYETIYSEAGCEIISKPFLVKEELEVLSTQSSADFVASLNLPGRHQGTVGVLEILNGGHYYFLPDAYARVLGKEPDMVCSMRAKRYLCVDTNDWEVNVWDQKGDITACDTLLIGDTIATGTTLAGTLGVIVKQFKEANKPLPNIYLFAIAGSDQCIPKLQGVAQELKQQGKELKLVFANCSFFLNDNGTDLEFGSIQPEAKNYHEKRFHPQAWAKLRAEYGPVFGDLKCAVWDWGDRFTQPAEHLQELLHHFKHRAEEDTPAYFTGQEQAARSHLMAMYIDETQKRAQEHPLGEYTGPPCPLGWTKWVLGAATVVGVVVLGWGLLLGGKRVRDQATKRLRRFT
jgi:hypothetical protein